MTTVVPGSGDRIFGASGHVLYSHFFGNHVFGADLSR